MAATDDLVCRVPAEHLARTEFAVRRESPVSRVHLERLARAASTPRAPRAIGARLDSLAVWDRPDSMAIAVARVTLDMLA